MNTNKPYQGEIHEWERRHFEKTAPWHMNTLGYRIHGMPKNHPFFSNWILTSPVVDYDETTGVLETLNSIYKLVPPGNTTSVKK